MHFQDALAEDIRNSAARMLSEDVGPMDITAQLIPEQNLGRARVISRGLRLRWRG